MVFARARARACVCVCVCVSYSEQHAVHAIASGSRIYSMHLARRLERTAVGRCVFSWTTQKQIVLARSEAVGRRLERSLHAVMLYTPCHTNRIDGASCQVYFTILSANRICL